MVTNNLQHGRAEITVMSISGGIKMTPTKVEFHLNRSIKIETLW